MNKTLLEALKNRCRDQQKLDELFEKTTDFSSCLCFAITAKQCNKDFKSRLPSLVVDTAFEDGYPQDFIDRIFEKTTCFADCLGRAITLDYPQDFLDRLFERSVVYENTLKVAILHGGYSQNFLDRLLDATVGDIRQSLFYAILSKKIECPYYSQIFKYMPAREGGYPQDFLDRLFEKTTDFTWCLRAAICAKHPQEFLDRIFEKTTDFDYCLSAILVCGGSYTQEFINSIFEKTIDFTGCLGLAIYKKYPQEFLDRLFEKTVDFKWCLAAALELDHPPEFLERLFEKEGKTLLCSSIQVKPEYKKYYDVLVKNKECFICLLDFENITDPGVKIMECGHLVHMECYAPFKCPYH